jgi:hypothetical protein
MLFVHHAYPFCMPVQHVYASPSFMSLLHDPSSLSSSRWCILCCMFMLNVLSAYPYCMSELFVYGVRPCFMSIPPVCVSMLHCPLCVFMLLVHAGCPVVHKSMLHVYASCPRFMAMFPFYMSMTPIQARPSNRPFFNLTSFEDITGFCPARA